MCFYRLNSPTDTAPCIEEKFETGNGLNENIEKVSSSKKAEQQKLGNCRPRIAKTDQPTRSRKVRQQNTNEEKDNDEEYESANLILGQRSH